MHGKSSFIHHQNNGIFKGIPTPFSAIRYHSLIVQPDDLPECLEVTAWTDDRTIMGLKHKTYPVEGIQFHPESFMTEWGKELLGNFIKGKKREQ
jgi:anthranilate synthase component 2